MAHIWILDTAQSWKALQLGPEAAWISSRPPHDLRDAADGDPEGGVDLIPRDDAGREQWLLLADWQPGVWVNGLPLSAGMRVLADRDEIRLAAGSSVFFSTERLALIEPYPGGDSSAACPRCRLPIEKGSPAVMCPACLVWYHQTEEFPCWLYSARCGLCSQPTDLAAGFRWSLEGT